MKPIRKKPKSQQHSFTGSTEPDINYKKEIDELNFGIKQFLNSFKTFQNQCNVYDNELLYNLGKIVDQVDSFVDGNPKEITNVVDSLHEDDYHDLENSLLNKAISTETVNSNATNKSILRENFNKNSTKPKEKLKPFKKFIKKEIKEKKEVEVNLPKKAKQLLRRNLDIYIKIQSVERVKVTEESLQPLQESLFMTKIKEKFSNAELLFFGSRITGLGNVNSDVDIFLNLDNSFFNYHQTSNSIIEKLKFVEGLLSEDPDWTELRAITDARVPILRGFFAPLKLKCDISFSHGLGCLNTRLIKHLFEACPLFYKMCLLMKTWKVRCQLTTAISTYAIIMMVLFYLQKSDILPPIEKLQESLCSIIKIGPWWSDFNEISTTDEYPSDGDALLRHMHKFFEFYKNFAYDKYIICPLLGKEVPIENVRKHFGLPQRYFDYIEWNDSIGGLQLDKPMIVQDPLELNHNVVKGLSASHVNHLRKLFALSLAQIEEKYTINCKPTGVFFVQ